MAGGMDLGSAGKGGKKPLDVAINLVPFIDLMMVTIAFLIMTAVWTQVGRLQVTQAGGPTISTEQPPPTTVPVTLLVAERELRLTVGGVSAEAIPLTRNASNRLQLAALAARLKDVRAGLPDQSAITLLTEDLVRYEDLVDIIDVCIGEQLPAVTVSPVSG